MNDKVKKLIETKAEHLWEFMGVPEHLSIEWEQIPEDEKQEYRDEICELIKDLALIDREGELPLDIDETINYILEHYALRPYFANDLIIKELKPIVIPLAGEVKK